MPRAEQAKGEDRDPPQIAARKQVDEPEERPGVLPHELLKLERIDSGSRDMGTETVDRQQSECEQDPLPEIRNAEYIGESFEKLVHSLLPVAP